MTEQESSEIIQRQMDFIAGKAREQHETWALLDWQRQEILRLQTRVLVLEKEAVTLRDRHAAALEQRRQLVYNILNEKCAAPPDQYPPEDVTIERALFKAYEEQVPTLQRFDRHEPTPEKERSLMFKQTRVHPDRGHA